MTPKWPWNLSISRRFVCPTYCIPHLLHVMQYIRLLLLHETLCFASYSRPVNLDLILPVLSKSGQYLQFVLLQGFVGPILGSTVAGSFSGW
jgi:hypothetical protein